MPYPPDSKPLCITSAVVTALVITAAIIDLMGAR